MRRILENTGPSQVSDLHTYPPASYLHSENEYVSANIMAVCMTSSYLGRRDPLAAMRRNSDFRSDYQDVKTEGLGSDKLQICHSE
jgi:hypothetical protein